MKTEVRKGSKYKPTKKLSLSLRRRKVARMYLFRQTEEEIAEKLGVDRSTINRDIKHLNDEWAKTSNLDLKKIMMRELAELDDMEGHCRHHLGNDEGQPTFLANSKWMSVLLHIKERRARMLGLDAPAQHELAGRGGGAIQTETRGVHDLSGFTNKQLDDFIATSERILTEAGIDLS